ncbi:MAG: dienelactone hydrolase family protein [Campylobacterota bacterium]|nr:dienelactone hydrolase family protein [Campylobacterota bacterium]
MKKLLLAFVFLLSVLTANEYEKVEFPSEDGLLISAHLYSDHNRSKPFILLFHQATYSKGEYLEIAPKLTKMGFNVMAVDLRSGDKINGVENETSDRAFEKDLDISYLATIPDIQASISYTKKHFSKGKLLIWGSSYSAGLVLYIASQTPGIDAVLSFSPGEYYKKREKQFIQNHMANLTVPVFITSAKDEKMNWWVIFQAITSKEKSYFLPQTKGVHGAKALWENNSDHQRYWNAVKKFLKEL